MGAPNWLGDVVMAEPFLRRLCTEDSLRVLLLCRPGVADLCRRFRAHLPSLQVFTYEEFDERFDAPLPASTTLWLNLALDGDVLLRARARRAQHIWGSPRPDTAALITRSLGDDFLRRDVHHIYNYAAVLSLLGLAPLEPSQALPTLLGRSNAARSSLPTTVVLNTSSSNDPAKRYPAERFRQLALDLCALYPDVQVVLTGLLQDESRNAAISSALQAGERCRDTTGRLTTAELIDEIAVATLLISGDTGPMHVAAALGTPCIGLFGPTSPLWTSPVGERAYWLAGEVECAPCFLSECPLPRRICFDQTTPKRVLQLVQQEKLL